MKTKFFATILTAALFAITTSTSFAQTRFDRNHPRRDEVNDRISNQNKRIHNQVREGDLNHRQAARLHQADRNIRHEERNMAARNGGHLTRGEQARINHQENRVSRRIGQ
jgi:hypothetical protein